MRPDRGHVLSFTLDVEFHMNFSSLLNMNALTACWIRYMSSNVYVLIFLLLYSIELNIGVRPTGLC